MTPAPSRIGLATRLKWQAFRLLEALSDLRGNAAAGHLEVRRPERPLPALWVFVSTIGELNAIDPLLKALVARRPDLKLVLISDHPHYRDSYGARYPAAEICITRGHGDDAAELAALYPPRALVVGEIPCWPGDAPCRFSFAFLLEAKRRGAFTAIVNGWLYFYPSSCRMDAIERRLFQRDTLGAFDVIAAQTEAIRDALVAAGAPAERVTVTGNIKFDALPSPQWSPAQARSPAMLGSLLAAGRPIVVAGCVTELPEQQLVLDAFAAVRAAHPEALIVLAPRHPEVKERMEALAQLLREMRLPSLFRSAVPDVAVGPETACLVLDTIGELRDFFAAATVAYMGTDHNVLEPLGFEKPVTVKPGWDPTYPSYPVYRMLLDANCLQEAANVEELSACWLEWLDNPDSYRDRKHLIHETLAAAKGAVARHMALIEPWLGR